MTLPLTGPLKLSDINVELGNSTNQQLSISQARLLANIPSGPIRYSDLRGKSLFQPQEFYTSTNYTITGTIQNLKVLAVGSGAGGGTGQGAGGGGAGRIFTTATFAVQAGDTIVISIGVGGNAGARGTSTTVQNSRTGQLITAVSGYQGGNKIGANGGSGGISIGPSNATIYGVTGSNQGAGAGGSGASGQGGLGVGTVGGAGSAPYTVQINSTMTYYLSAGGAGNNTGINTGTPGANNSGNGGDGNARGGSGFAVLYA